MKANSFVGVIGVLGLPLVLVSGPAAAADGKRYPGTECATVVSTDVVDRNSFGGTFNPSATRQVSVLCPIIRDNLGSASTGINKAIVKAVDQNANANGDVFCAISVRDKGGLVAGNSSNKTSGSSPSAQTLNFGPVAVPKGGFVNLFCSLPPTASTGVLDSQSGIVMYEVEEN